MVEINGASRTKILETDTQFGANRAVNWVQLKLFKCFVFQFLRSEVADCVRGPRVVSRPPRRIEPGSDPISISDGWIQMSYISGLSKNRTLGSPRAIKTAKNPKDTGIGVRVPPIECIFVIEMDQFFQGLPRGGGPL